jgi:hypothetical protein
MIKLIYRYSLIVRLRENWMDKKTFAIKAMPVVCLLIAAAIKMLTIWGDCPNLCC